MAYAMAIGLYAPAAGEPTAATYSGDSLLRCWRGTSTRSPSLASSFSVY